METSTQVLIILVSGTLTVFLIAATVVAIFTIQVLRSLKRVSKKAEAIAEKAENIGSFFEHTGEKLALGRLVNNVLDTIRHNKSDNKEK